MKTIKAVIFDFDYTLGDSTNGIELEDLKPITICHGSPLKVNEKLLPDNENTFSIMERNVNNYILCGHTHIPGTIVYNGKIVLNAGSVGVSLHGNGKAQFMILHGTVLAKAICKQKYGECIWPNVPEECWEQAVKEMIERCM